MQYCSHIDPQSTSATGHCGAGSSHELRSSRAYSKVRTQSLSGSLHNTSHSVEPELLIFRARAIAMQQSKL